MTGGAAEAGHGGRPRRRTSDQPVPPAAAGTRRRPQQTRSRKKVNAILDVAEELVTDAGADALTTTAVAERAGIAVGTLYQYFDGMPAVIEALAARHAARYAEHLQATISKRRLVHKRDAANAALDALIDYYRDEPALRALWRSAPRATGEGFLASGDVMLGIVTRALVDQGLVAKVDEAFRREAEVQWAVASALLQVAFRLDPDGDPGVLAHLRHLFELDVPPARTRTRPRSHP